MAERAGVSTSTVSHVVNETRFVSEELRLRVRQAMQELGYQPNALARSLRMKRSHTLGMIVPDVSNPFFSEIVRAVEDVAFRQGYSLLLCNSEGDLTKEQLFSNALVEKQVDGILFVSAGASSDLVEQLLRSDVPIVVVDRELPDVQVDCVLADNRAGGAMATAHLIELGHRRIGCITGPPLLALSTQRVAGYREMLQAHHIPFDDCLVVSGSFKFESGYEAAKALLQTHDPPTAVFACNDLMAVGFLRAVAEAGLQAPADISVIGFDNVPLAAFTNPALTTIGQPIAGFGTVAIELLIARIDDKALPVRQETLPTELVVRESTAPARRAP